MGPGLRGRAAGAGSGERRVGGLSPDNELDFDTSLSAALFLREPGETGSEEISARPHSVGPPLSREAGQRFTRIGFSKKKTPRAGELEGLKDRAL